MKEFRFIDLFCGIGGFHQAMSSLGGECVFACDIDADCRSTYKKNYGIEPYGDITKISPEDIPAHDVLCAGFPCQAFSKAGNRLGFEDSTKGTLFFDVCRILKHHRPKYALLENVRNLASHDNGNTWKVIYYRLRELGYNLLKDPVIFSPHYIGIPQHRERVFIMCVREDIGELKPFDFSYDDKNLCSIETILQDDSDIPNVEAYRISDDMAGLIDLWNEFLQNIKVERLPGFPVWSDRLRELDPEEDLSQYPAWKRNFILKNNSLYIANREFIDAWIEKAKQNPLFFGAKAKLEWQAGQTKKPDIWKQIFQLRPSGIRVKVNTYFPALVAIVQTSIIGSRKRFLTPRECARLQCFPESFIVDDKEAQAYKQFGNSVNVRLVKLFALHMFGKISCYNDFIEFEKAGKLNSPNRRLLGRKSKVNSKIRLTRGNAFELEKFGADGVIAFVNEGFTPSSSYWNDFVSRHDGSPNCVVYKYNHPGNKKPTLKEYQQIVTSCMDELAKAGVSTVVMPPLNGTGGTDEDKIKTLENGIAFWLEEHSDTTIDTVYISIL